MTIPASLSSTQAASRTWDAAVVGAGPAGSMAALLLARAGLSVLLADRVAFPRSKVCGCCLNGAALAALQAVGTGWMPPAHGAVPLHAILLAAGGRVACIDLPGGVVLSRDEFDAALVRVAIAAGVSFLPGVQVRPGEVTDDCRYVFLEDGRSTEMLPARVVIAADGLGGQVLARAGALAPVSPAHSRFGAGVVVASPPAFYRTGTIYMACGAGGYVGLVRLENGQLDIAAALDVEAVRVKRSPGEVVEQVLDGTGWPMPTGITELKWKGTPTLTRRARQVAGTRLFAIGDAAGYVEPFTGEGIARALATGTAVAPIAARAAKHWHDALAGEWSLTFRRLRGHHQIACRIAAGVLRRPWLAGACVAMLARAPRLAAPIVRGLNSPVSLIPGSL
jgi:flavin-dependent dehydrogenase